MLRRHDNTWTTKPNSDELYITIQRYNCLINTEM